MEGTPTVPAPTVGAFARTRDWWGALLLFGCALDLYLNLFANPQTPFLLGGDQEFFWVDAQRLLYGEQVYRDFLEHTAPGTDLVYLGFFHLFGPRIWVPNLVVLLLGVGLCWMCWRLACSLMSRWQASLAVGMFLVLVYGKVVNGTHHWFSVLAVLGALTVLTKGRTPTRVAMAGALLGLATFFTQTRGPIVAVTIAACLAYEQVREGKPLGSHLKRQALLFLPLVLTWLVLMSYYFASIGWRTLWFFQVTYVREYALTGWSLAGLGWPQGLSLSAPSDAFRLVFSCVVMPVTYLVSLWLCWRAERRERSPRTLRIVMVAAAGAAMYLEIVPNPSWFRFYCVAAPAVILIPWLMERAGRFAVPALRVLSAAILGLALAQALSRHISQRVTVELPAGRVATSSLPAEKLGWLAEHTHPGEFVLQSGWLSLYVPLALRNPVFLDTIESGAGDRMGYLSLSIRQIEAREVRYLIWSPRLDSPSEGLAPFRRYMERSYRRVWTFSDHDEVWERK